MAVVALDPVVSFSSNSVEV